MSLRPADPQDAGAIAHVHVNSWRETYRGIVPENYLASLDEGQRTSLWRKQVEQGATVLVALREDLLVGFISGGAIREPLGDYDAKLYALYLLTQAQRAGTGTLLLRRLAAVLAQEGWKSMVVWRLKRMAAPVSTKAWVPLLSQRSKGQLEEPC